MEFIDWPFWLAAAGATFIKLVTSVHRSLWQACTTAFSALFSAYIFAEPSLAWLNLDRDVWFLPVVVLWALTGEGLMRLAISITSDPETALEWLKAWHGGGSRGK